MTMTNSFFKVSYDPPKEILTLDSYQYNYPINLKTTLPSIEGLSPISGSVGASTDLSSVVKGLSSDLGAKNIGCKILYRVDVLLLTFTSLQYANNVCKNYNINGQKNTGGGGGTNFGR